jgi:hypothetical protein
VVRATRDGHVILCGRCGATAIAEAQPDGRLTFPLDAHEDWKGWEQAPGGTWRTVHPESFKRPALSGLLDLLPAIIECPGCLTHNLLDPRLLRLRVIQTLAPVPQLAGLAG